MTDNNCSTKYSFVTSDTSHEVVKGFTRLTFFDDNAFLRMQAHNVAIVDGYITEIEKKVLKGLFEEAHISAETSFLSAQTQMWIFATYELMRTWRQRARELLTLAKEGRLSEKISETRYSGGFHHFNEGIYAKQAKELLDNPDIARKLEEDLRVSEMPFVMLETVRVPLAKHEVRREGSLAYMPGYARIASA